MRHSLSLALLGLAVLLPAAEARELGTAPQVTVLGFSADGRHFGFEQRGGDGVDERGAFAIDVVDRTTGASSRGFPRGVTQMSWEAEPSDARRAAMQGLRIDPDREETMTDAALERRVRAAVRAPLAALRITDRGRRLGGTPLTDLTERQGPVRVMMEPDVIGAHPGVSMKYQVTATYDLPPDPDASCRERETSLTVPITVTVKPEIPSYDEEAAKRNPEAFRTRSQVMTWIAPPKTCLTATRVSDVFRNSSGSTLAVLVAIVVDVGHTDGAEYRAVAFPLE